MIAIDKKGIEVNVNKKSEESNSSRGHKRRAKEQNEKLMTHEKADRLKRAGIVR